VQLPDQIARAIEGRAEAVGFSALKRAAAALSEAYREGRPPRLVDAERAAAYLVTRMPATYAAAHAALREVRARVGTVASVLDAGAGTGAASLAARELFPDAAITLLERGRAPAQAARQWLPEAALIAGDVTRMAALPPHDLVIAAYSLGEFGRALAPRLWEAARVALVVIEPGTPRGFALIRAVRADLLARGARMAAPCPAETACPLAEPDWCHFAARAERSSLHRRIKDADLGYEDEKFSYVALARQTVEVAPSRIIRRPRAQPGLVVLETCTPRGVETVRVARRERERFRVARKAAWGDAGIS
jgi:ribosomal protein RSM22 (predicted rRNA methylase)